MNFKIIIWYPCSFLETPLLYVILLDNQKGFNPKQGLKEFKRFVQNWEWTESFQSVSIRIPCLCKGIWEVDLCSGRKETQLKFKVLQGKFFHPALGGKGGEPGVIQDTPPLATSPWLIM